VGETSVVSWVTNNTPVAAGSSMQPYDVVIANLAVQNGLISAAALNNWATTNHVQVSNIFTGTPSVTAATVTESLTTALNDPLLTTLGGAPTLTQAQATAAITQQAQSSASTSPGPTPIAADNPLADVVQCAYIAYYGRPADAAGLSYWEAQLTQAGGNLNAIATAFGNSAESQALYGSQSVAQMVSNIYEQSFNRAPDAAGSAYWVGQISSGAVSLASAALAIFNGATGSDKSIINNKLVVADAYTAVLTTDTVASSLYSGNTAAANARVFMSAVSSSTTQAVQLAGIAPQVSHDIQSGITGDLTGIGVSVQLVGTSATSAALLHPVG